MNWSELSTVLKGCGGIALRAHSLCVTPSSIESFPIVAVAPTAPVLPAVVAPAVPALPAVVAPATPTVVLAPAVPAVVVAPDVVPESKPRRLLPSKHVIDPVVLGIEFQDPLYEGAPPASRRAIETEGAQKLEAVLDGLYKSAAGRSRGWTKVGLEGLLKPRCASGGDLHALDRAKKGFIWALATEDKALSAFLDFICCARRIRCAVWNFEKKTVHLYPAADDASAESTDFPLLHVDNTGHRVNGIGGDAEFLAHVDREGWTLAPPASVTHSLSGLTLEELESVGRKLGMASVEGKKADRVTAIASFKTRARLQ